MAGAMEQTTRQAAYRGGRLAAVAAAFVLWLAPAPVPASDEATTSPARVISVDHCADQYVLALADRAQVAALSPAADRAYSYYADRAKDLPQQPVSTEAILMAAPDAMIRLWGGAQGTETLLARHGVPVVQVRYGTDMDVTRTNLRRVGDALGQLDKAERLIADMDRRLDRAARRRLPEGERPEAIYLTPSGTTAGQGTFVDAVMTAAGLENRAATGGLRGWRSIDLETLAMNPPEVIVGGFFDTVSEGGDAWSIARHSFLSELVARVPFIPIPGRIMTCQAWYALDAVERIQSKLATLPGMLRPPETARAAP